MVRKHHRTTTVGQVTGLKPSWPTHIPGLGLDFQLQPSFGLGPTSHGHATPVGSTLASFPTCWASACFGLLSVLCLPAHIAGPHAHTHSQLRWALRVTNRRPAFAGPPSPCFPLDPNTEPSCGWGSLPPRGLQTTPRPTLGPWVFYSRHPMPHLSHGTSPKIILGL